MDSHSSTPILKIEDVSHVVSGKQVLDSISADVLEGGIFGIVGVNSSGKTALMELIVGGKKPTKGEVKYKASLLDPVAEGYASISSDIEARRLFGFCSQEFSFYKDLSVQENMEYFSSLYARGEQKFSSNIRKLVSLFELDPKAIAGNLPFGEKRKLELACSLAHNPKILVLDSPTSGLNLIDAEKVLGILMTINQNGTTIIIASHDLDLIEKHCTDLVVLNKKILSRGLQGIRELHGKEKEIIFVSSTRDYSRYDFPNSRIEDEKLIIQTDNPKSAIKRLGKAVDFNHDEVEEISIRSPKLSSLLKRVME